jgi:flagellar biosynthesis/type III secretory pathway protein FliH
MTDGREMPVVQLHRQPDPVTLLAQAVETAVEQARQRWERELQGTVAQVWNEARSGVGPEVEDSRSEAYERGVADGIKEGFEAAAAVGLAAVARVRDAVGLNAQIRSEEKTAAIRAACDMAERQWNAVLGL